MIVLNQRDVTIVVKRAIPLQIVQNPNFAEDARRKVIKSAIVLSLRFVIDVVKRATW